jgi:hypothetical protein
VMGYVSDWAVESTFRVCGMCLIVCNRSTQVASSRQQATGWCLGERECVAMPTVNRFDVDERVV